MAVYSSIEIVSVLVHYLCVYLVCVYLVCVVNSGFVQSMRGRSLLMEMKLYV